MLGQQVTELETNLRQATIALNRLAKADSMLDNALVQWKDDTIKRIDSVNTEARLCGDADLELSKFDSIITTMLSMRVVFKAASYSYKLVELCERMRLKLSAMIDYRSDRSRNMVITPKMNELRQQLSCMQDMFRADKVAAMED